MEGDGEGEGEGEGAGMDGLVDEATEADADVDGMNTVGVHSSGTCDTDVVDEIGCVVVVVVVGDV